jgi:DNA modification methylase
MTASATALRPVHPFPARMAPSIIQRRLKSKKSLVVVDPMAGSGTTLVASRLQGHRGFGFDTDPLALLIAKAWSSDIDPDHIRLLATRVLNSAMRHYRSITTGRAYPKRADAETRAFIRFWFDQRNRRQLAALSVSISSVHEAAARAVLWCAFSRMIITKDAGVSLAMDVSHSRPHKAYDIAPVTPFVRFPLAVEQILRASHFSEREELPKAAIRRGDARNIPLKDRTADLVITSPPYVNAIDYLRGHKLSLVWMGHSVGKLRDLRSRNIGSEKFQNSSADIERWKAAEKVINHFAGLPMRAQRMLLQYFHDMDCVLAEISRILKRTGRAVVVVGNSTIRGIFIHNSKILTRIARKNGLHLVSARRRELKENRRYLPPPARHSSGAAMQSRMNEEVILLFEKKRSVVIAGPR